MPFENGFSSDVKELKIKLNAEGISNQEYAIKHIQKKGIKNGEVLAIRENGSVCSLGKNIEKGLVFGKKYMESLIKEPLQAPCTKINAPTIHSVQGKEKEYKGDRLSRINFRN